MSPNIVARIVVEVLESAPNPYETARTRQTAEAAAGAEATRIAKEIGR
ncbi:hypothetical protein [Naasia sp. SYSU D00057]|nr:hypothetical protein [Naasia sp. SYSU D00057]